MAAASKCAEEGSTGKCIKEKVKDVGGKKDDCQKEGEGDCKKDMGDCEGAAPKDQGKEFCKERNTQCLEKATAKCKDEHQKEGEGDCKKDMGDCEGAAPKD